MKSKVFKYLIIFLAIANLASGQWVIIDTMFTHDENSGFVYHYAKFIDNGTIFHYYTHDPGTPSSMAHMVVRKTINDGVSWSILINYLDYSYLAYDLEFPNVDTGFFCYNFNSTNTVVRSFNGGVTWEIIQNNGPVNMFFIHGIKGYGINGKQTMRYVNDYFYVTDTLPYDVNAYNSKLYFTDNQIGYIIFAEPFSQHRRKLLRTLDDGNNWDLVLSDSTESFLDLCAPSDSVCFVSGASGKIYKTIDIGNSWTIINTNISSPVISMSFTDPLTGWVISHNNMVYRTNDGGLSWSSQILPHEAYELRKIKMIDDQTGYIHGVTWGSGLHEIILKTENGGLSNIINNPVELNHIDIFPNPFINKLKIKPVQIVELVSAEIYNITGEKLFEINFYSRNPGEIDLSHLNSGIYILIISNNDFIQTERIVKLK